MSESSARASLYVFSVSSVLIALGFISQVAETGDLFNTFALTVLPLLYVLGVVTFVRLVECAAEDFRYWMAINRIRGYYEGTAGDDRADRSSEEVIAWSALSGNPPPRTCMAIHRVADLWPSAGADVAHGACGRGGARGTNGERRASLLCRDQGHPASLAASTEPSQGVVDGSRGSSPRLPSSLQRRAVYRLNANSFAFGSPRPRLE
jgi:hypothetical protein